MNITQKQRKYSATARHLIAGLLLALFLFVLAMAHYKALHHAFHGDSERAEHQCAVTLLATGQIDLPTSAAILSFVSFVFLMALARQTDTFLSVDYLFALGRAPPSLA